jgi:hypothetical protein
MGIKEGPLPYCITRNISTGFVRRCKDVPYSDLVPYSLYEPRTEGFRKPCCIFYKFILFSRCITFGKNYDVEGVLGKAFAGYGSRGIGRR